jgi:hypothetical protein
LIPLGLVLADLDGSAIVAVFSLISFPLESSAPSGLFDGLIWPKGG